LLEASERQLPAQAAELLRSYLPIARLTGQRTGELHRILGTAAHSSYLYLTPEPFTQLYQRSFYQSLRGLTCVVLETLRERLPRLPPELGADAERVGAGEAELLARFRPLLDRKLTATRIACHGNYHLQQILRTGGDVTIIDFEGEPPRPLFERRLKRTPLVDVVSMVRSLHYAARFALTESDDCEWSLFWRHWVAAAFLQAYFSTVDRRLLPSEPAEFRFLFEICLLERAVYELGYELDHRPDYIGIPLRDLRDLLDGR
jgi:maltose alpha-D-glucosyltransferase/alpha-amylase